jgi:hypothetical protein
MLGRFGIFMYFCSHIIVMEVANLKTMIKLTKHYD